MSTAVVSAPPRPYKGLAAFGDSEVDALFFFGRERESEVIAANLVASRLTILYGPSGVGKSSVLRAGAARRLRAIAPEAAVIVHDAWAGDPVSSVLDAVVQSAPDLAPPPAGAALADAFADWARRRGGELYLVLDQFEELFVYHKGGGALTQELAAVVNRRGLPVNVLISLREDALAELDVFTGRIPNVFGNYVALDRLDRTAGRRAVVGPLERYNELVAPEARFELGPELVDAVLDEVAAGRVELGAAGKGVAAEPGPADAIEAPFLQLVMERLWEAERERGSQVLRRETLAELGGAEAIVRAHLDRAVGALGPIQRDMAARIFTHLVTPSGTKIAHAVADLAEYARTPEEDLRPVLSSLRDERILRPLDGRFEIFHDVLADAVAEWRLRYEARRDMERRHRRVLAVAAIALAGFAIMAATTVFAVVQRQDARDSARRAQARELAARASVELAVDPQRSLSLAVESAELEPAAEFEEVLRLGLLSAQLRRVWHLGVPPSLAIYSSDGRFVVVAAGERLVVRDARDGRVMAELRLEAPVLTARFDGDGFVDVVTGRSVRSVDPATGEQRVLFESPASLSAAFFAGRSSTVAVASRTDVTVVDLAGGVTRTIPSAPRPLRVVLSPDTRTIAVVGEAASERVQTRLYDSRSGRRLALLDQIGVRDVEFSPSGELLATASADGTTMLWEARSGVLVRTLDDDGGSIDDVDFSADGSFLATGSSDGGVRVWKVETGDRFFFFVGHTGGVTEVAFRPDGDVLASASSDRTIRLWFTGGIEQGRLAALLVGHADTVTTAAFAPGGRSLLTGGNDRTARVWNAQIEQKLQLVARERTPVVAAAFTGDGRGVVAATAGGLVRMVPLSRRATASTLRHRAPIEVAAFAPRHGLALAAGESGEATLWRGQIAMTLEHGARVAAVAFSDDGTAVATAGEDGTVKLWSTRGGEALTTLRHGAPVADIAFSPDGLRIASAGADGLVRRWDTGSGRLLQTFRGHSGSVVSVTFSPDGTTILSAGVDRTARLWHVDGRPVRVLRGHPQPLTGAVFDRAGAQIVTTSQGSSNNAILWGAATGRLVHVLVGHFGTVSGAAFSFDGRWIVTAGPISAGLWPTATGRLLDYLRGHTGLLTAAAFSPDGYRILTAGRDGTVRTYDCTLCLPVEGLADLARRRLGATGS